MIYFFVKGDSFVQCELYPGHPNVVRVIEPDGSVHSERHGSQTVNEAWDRVCTRWVAEGWDGPFGRDPRS